MSAYTSGNDDATAELVNEPRAARRQRIRRSHHGTMAMGPGCCFNRSPSFMRLACSQASALRSWRRMGL